MTDTNGDLPTDENQGKIDLDNLTDEEVLNLKPEDMANIMSPEEVEAASNESEPANSDDLDLQKPEENEKVSKSEQEQEAAAKAAEDRKSEDEKEKGLESNPGPDTSISGMIGNEVAQDEAAKKAAEEAEAKAKAGAAADENKQDPDKKTEKPAIKLEDYPEEVVKAQSFYEKISKPFKADGREFQVKSPEDAVRLMQQGVNYSRRMAELKPVRAIGNMLKQHGLDDPQKLSHLIDISKGDTKAIQKLLRDKNIDPIDFDTSEDNGYRAPNYAPDEKSIAFTDVLEQVVPQEGGREILTDIQDKWDRDSIDFVRDNPQSVLNLLEQKQSGVYDLINNELNYQKALGHLTDVPFIQAYHQVGNAMEKAGAFKVLESTQEAPKPEPKPGLAPIDTGSRKAAQKPKTEQPNQQLSSIQQPSSAPSGDAPADKEIDYSQFSDEEFLKLQAPE